MYTNKITWVDFYTEFAIKLLAYKNDRKSLIEKLQSVYKQIEMKFPKMESDGSVIDIDPFTVFGLFNKGITNENRKLILGGLGSAFGIESEIPSDFDGIPVLNNQKATFFHFEKDRQADDINNLWEMFDIAIKYADNSLENEKRFEMIFEKVIQQKGVRWNLTMGLYWIRPDKFINLDSRNREFIIAEHLLSDEYLDELNQLRNVPSSKQYCQLCTTISELLLKAEATYSSFPELSLAAWTSTKTSSSKMTSSDSTYWPSLEEYNPNISIDQWIEFLQEDKKTYPSTLEMLKAMLELGGEATCKRIAELLGEHPSSCVSRGNSLGRRAKNKFNLPACMDEDKERFFPVPFVGRNIIENGTSLYAWKLRNELKEALEKMKLGEIKTVDELKTDVSKNTILYGPPGTGKTYNTVIYAVAIIENKKLQAIKDEDYDDVLARYNEYKSKELIEFTTFHQSYGYEDFIEGIKPIMDNSDDDQGDIQYQISSGLFKSFCDKAGQPVLKQKKKDIGLNSSPTIWKVSLEGTYDNPTRTECMKNGHIRVGYDSYGENISSDTNFVDGGKNVINAFIYKMKVGDIVLSCYSATTIDAIGVVTGEYEWHDEYEHYKRLRKVDWIVKGISEDITEINNGSSLTLSSVYKLNISLADVMELIAKKEPTTAVEEKKKNYVFVIDEINRGNISKIFGELITLIEPTKRIGQPEGMKAKLPYSQKAFGVPDNVYIIGTMNTADRSIAAIDTALRRRFKFKEMLPDADVLENVYVDDISIKELLIKMNKRIEVLYDREHTLGHAYFLPLKLSPTIETLAGIFSDNVIPLLQEYFYEDYEKIRLVLGDNNKANVDEQFILAVSNDYSKLFGNTEYDFDEECTYEINNDALENIESYRSI